MAKEKNPAFGERIITGEGRCSFPHLAEPDNSKFGQGKYHVDLIFEDDSQSSKLKADCIAHAKAFYKVEDVSEIKFPWKDGNKNAKYTGYEGNEFITAKCKQQPNVVDRNKKVFDPKKVYGGCNIRLSVTPLAYEMEDEVFVVENGQKRKETLKIQGISLVLNAVQFVGDNERFGGGGDGFDDSYCDADTEADDGGF